jgi:Loader and inhibitor of phage G40P.
MVTRKDITKVLDLLQTAYPHFYSKVDDSSIGEIINLWHAMFRDEEPAILITAIHELISTHKGYPPDIATVKEQIQLVMSAAAGEPTDHELWNIYKKAVGNCMYKERTVFDSLPPLLQKFAGSPGGMLEHGLMDSERFSSVVYSNFLRTIPHLRKREEYSKRLPDGLKEIAEKFSMPEGSDKPRLTLSEENDRRNELLDRIQGYGK